VVQRQIQNALRKIPSELLRALNTDELVALLRRYHAIPKRQSPQARPQPSSPASSSLRQYADNKDAITGKWLAWLAQGREGFWPYWDKGEKSMLKPFFDWVETSSTGPVADIGCGLGRLDAQFAVAAAMRGQDLTMVEPDDYRRNVAEMLVPLLQLARVEPGAGALRGGIQPREKTS
jgi:hypothetical protein